MECRKRGTQDLRPQYDQVGPRTQDPFSETRDMGPQNFQVRPGTQDPWSVTLINNLLAWKFEYYNESIGILLEN